MKTIEFRTREGKKPITVILKYISSISLKGIPGAWVVTISLINGHILDIDFYNEKEAEEYYIKLCEEISNQSG